MLFAIALALFTSSTWAQTADEVIDAAGFQGGVVVHLGCTDGALVSQIHQAVPTSMTHGIVADASQLQQARAVLLDEGANGSVSLDAWDGKTIPFVDEFVNVLVVAEGQSVDQKEIDRVLTPGGKAVLVKDGKLTVTTKAQPDDIDDWTHYLYGVDNNAVSKDTRIKPPLLHLKWTGSPRWSRHHDVMSSFSACVSTDNKVFYIFDEGQTFSPFLPTDWKLIARDAFNGTILWKRSIDRWFPSLHGLKSGPATLPRRLVAVDTRVYVTLGIEAPVSVIDGDTGETVQELKRTAGAEEILHDGDALYLVVDRNPEKIELTKYPFPGTRTWPVRKKSIVKYDLAQGEIAWEVEYAWVAPMSIALDESQVYCFDGSMVRSINKETGKEVWKSVELPMRANPQFKFGPSLVVKDGVVVFTGGENPVRGGSREKMHGLSAKTGKKLWEAYHPSSGYQSPEDLFVIDGKVWSADITVHRWDGPTGSTGVTHGTDLKSGEQNEKFAPDKDAYWFHHRCHPGKATENYMLTSRTGIEFVDLKNREWSLHHWVRGACLYGVMPANGMVYAPQHPCACYLGGKLYGLNALAGPSDDNVVLRATPDDARLVKGPAFDQKTETSDYADQWPTYRRDNRRNGATETPVADSLKQTWSAKLPGIGTPPVVAGGKVLISLKNKRAVYALDADSGEVVYRFFPGGRVDSPPTISDGRVYFGATDGYIYCLSLADGALVWKYQAAPAVVNHAFFEKIESTHPLHGTVLIRDSKLHTVCGRSMFLDGGMRYLILDAATGDKLVERVMDEKVPSSDEELQMRHEVLSMPMAMPDILSCNDDKVFMRFQEFDLEGNRLEIDFSRKLYGRVQSDVGKSFETLKDQKGEDAHIFSGTGFLDDSWWHRTYWIYGKHHTSGWSGYSQAGKTAPAGRILSADADGIFGWGRLKKYYRWSKQYEYMLFANDYDYQQKWARSVPILVRAMVKAGDQLHLVGPVELKKQEQAFRTITEEETQKVLAKQAEALEGEFGSLVLRVNAADGEIASGYRLPTVPVMDGVVATGGRLYITLADGSITCLGEKGASLDMVSADEIAKFNANSALNTAPAKKGGNKKAKPKK